MSTDGNCVFGVSGAVELGPTTSRPRPDTSSTQIEIISLTQHATIVVDSDKPGGEKVGNASLCHVLSLSPSFIHTNRGAWGRLMNLFLFLLLTELDGDACPLTPRDS